mgnify:CR=1 FL=1
MFLLLLGCPGGEKVDTGWETAAPLWGCPGDVSDDTSAAGGQVYALEGESVTATFNGGSASYTSRLSLMSPSSVAIGTLGQTAVGSSVELGTFAEGEELVFLLEVLDTGDSWQSGPASRNSDGFIHARVVQAADGLWYGGFEDLPNVGDSDYNDVCFQLEGDIDLVNPHE